MNSKLKFFSIIIFLILALLASCITAEVKNDPDLEHQLNPPTGLSAMALDSSIELTWTNMDEVKFKLYYGTETGKYEGKGAAEGDSPIVVETNSLKLTNLPNGIEYFVAVSAFTDSAESSLSNEVRAIPKAEPTAVKILPVHDGSIGQPGSVIPAWSFGNDSKFLFVGAYDMHPFLARTYIKFDLSELQIQNITSFKIVLNLIHKAFTNDPFYPAMSVFVIDDYGEMKIEDWDPAIIDALPDISIDEQTSLITIDVPIRLLNDGINALMFKTDSYMTLYYFASSEYTDDETKRPFAEVSLN